MEIAASKTTFNPILPEKELSSADSGADLLGQYSSRMNIIRFIAIASVVWGHCLFSFDQNKFSSLGDQLTQSVMLQMGRLGTIMFFIISGYFISGKIKNFNVLSYLRYRMFSVILPWLIFLMILMVIQMAGMGLWTKIFHQNIGLSLTVLYKLTAGNIFHSTYWFIPVSIFSVIILIIFKRYTDKLWFGLVLAAITVFYGINLYHSWIPANHTRAFLGYTFFAWLGMQLKMHLYFTNRFLNNISKKLLLTVIAFLFVAACAEGFYLSAIHSADPYGSIRISNSLLSIALFMALLKSDKLKPLISFKPQLYTFGIYLVHCIVIVLTMPAVNYYMEHINPFNNMALFITMEMVFFVTVFTISYVIVYLFKKMRSAITAARINDKAGDQKTIGVV